MSPFSGYSHSPVGRTAIAKKKTQAKSGGETEKHSGFSWDGSGGERVGERPPGGQRTVELHLMVQEPARCSSEGEVCRQQEQLV